jgi:hypothetical protein
LVLSERLWFIAAAISLERVAHRLQTCVRVRLGIDGRNITIVRINASEEFAIFGDHLADLYLALGLRAAVTAGTIEFAKVLNAVRINLDEA